MAIDVTFGPRPAMATCPPAFGQLEAATADRDRAWIARQAPRWSAREVERVVGAALADAERALGTVQTRVCVQLAAEPRSPMLARMRGIGGGATPSTGVISLFVAPTLASPDWPGDLAFAVAHEYHHLVARRPGSRGLDVLIREGLAHHFAWTLYPARLHPSANALATAAEESAAWLVVRSHFDLAGAEFTNRFMFGGAYFGGDVPTWAGYTIGFRIVRSFAERHPTWSPRDLMARTSGEILAGSRFGTPSAQR